MSKRSRRSARQNKKLVRNVQREYDAFRVMSPKRVLQLKVDIKAIIKAQESK